MIPSLDTKKESISKGVKLSKPEHMVIDDLIILGKAVPEEIRNGRRPNCVAGFSPAHGFIRLFPARWDMPLKRWNIVKVPVERAIRPRYDSRKESWKIIGSRSEWDRLSDKVELVGKYSPKKRYHLIESLVDDCCVQDIYASRRSIGIIKPHIIKYYLKEQEDLETYVQKTLDDTFRVNIKDEYPIEPRIKYQCSKCKARRGFHDQQLLEWGAYEWFRKNPDNLEQVWENLGFDNPDYDKYFLVGNLLQYKNAFIIISVIRFKKTSSTRLLNYTK